MTLGVICEEKAPFNVPLVVSSGDCPLHVIFRCDFGIQGEVLIASFTICFLMSHVVTHFITCS